MRARKLTAEEAVEIVVAGKHAEGAAGTVAMDVTLIDLLRDGSMKAALSWDNRLLLWPGTNPDPIFDPIHPRSTK